MSGGRASRWALAAALGAAAFTQGLTFVLDAWHASVTRWADAMASGVEVLLALGVLRPRSALWAATIAGGGFAGAALSTALDAAGSGRLSGRVLGPFTAGPGVVLAAQGVVVLLSSAVVLQRLRAMRASNAGDPRTGA